MTKRIGWVAVLTFVMGAFAAPGAQARTVTVGSPLIGSFSLIASFGGRDTLANTTLPQANANVVSPVNGTVVGWRLYNASTGPWSLRVLHAAGGGTFTGAGSSAMQNGGAGILSFPARIPIQAGDLVGIDNAGLPSDSIAEDPSGGFSLWSPALQDGSSPRPPTNTISGQLGFNADVVPAPTVNLISPTGGSIAGGTPVTVAGQDFSGASSVSFGGAPAASFTVNSDSRITAVSPPASGAARAGGSVDIQITTLGGQSELTDADQFTYTACIVPDVRGERPRVARRNLRNANCALGRIRGSGRTVRRQAVQPGTALPPGSRVNVRRG